MTTPAPTLTLDELRDAPTISVDEAAAVLGIGRRLAYELAESGDIEVMRLGRRIRVLTAPLLARLEGRSA